MPVSFSEHLLTRLADAERIVVLTGAGISAESGVPTFRDPGGLWQQFKPEELANVNAFIRNPKLVQSWYHHRRTIIETVAPNAGHEALVTLEDRCPNFTLITQNVDHLHQRAGSRNVIELHGNLTRNYCVGCAAPADEATLDQIARGAIGACLTCGDLIRPDVVWFGEMLPPGAFEAARRAAQSADVFLSIGTSAVVYPAADLPQVAKRAGAYTVEVNIEPSAIAAMMDEVLLGPAGEILPQLMTERNPS